MPQPFFLLTKVEMQSIFALSNDAHMLNTSRIISVWLILVALGSLALNLFPHRDYESITAIDQALMILVGFVCFAIFRNEPNQKNRFIFLNFSVAFTTAILWFGYLFVGKLFLRTSPYAGFYSYQYLVSFSFLLFSLAIVYVVIDTLLRDLQTLSKYAITILIVGGVFIYYNYPILANPKYLYSTEDIADYKALSSTVEKFQVEGIPEPSLAQIASSSTLYAWKNGERIGTLFDNQKVKRVAELLPYLEGSNYVMILYKPLHFNVIYMNVLCIAFVFLFFGYQYRNDPPQGAYIEKIVFLFLPYCSLEIVHFFGYIKSIEYASYLDYFRVGQYVSLINNFLLLVFFSLRLRFISSIKGEFYERELVSDSQHISRWRDGIDNLVVRHFLNPETFHGRLFTPRPPRERT